MKTKVTIDGNPAILNSHETANGWRCEVTWMLQWAKGASVLGRGDSAESAKADFFRRAADDGQEVAEAESPQPVAPEQTPAEPLEAMIDRLLPSLPAGAIAPAAPEGWETAGDMDPLEACGDPEAMPGVSVRPQDAFKVAGIPATVHNVTRGGSLLFVVTVAGREYAGETLADAVKLAEAGLAASPALTVQAECATEAEAAKRAGEIIGGGFYQAAPDAAGEWLVFSCQELSEKLAEQEQQAGETEAPAPATRRRSHRAAAPSFPVAMKTFSEVLSTLKAAQSWSWHRGGHLSVYVDNLETDRRLAYTVNLPREKNRTATVELRVLRGFDSVKNQWVEFIPREARDFRIETRRGEKALREFIADIARILTGYPNPQMVSYSDVLHAGKIAEHREHEAYLARLAKRDA